MSGPRIAINGFGRIGRTVLRIAKLRKHYDVIAVNDLASPEDLAYAFKYDSIHGTWPGEVSLSGSTLTVDGDAFEVLSEPDPAKLPWKALGVDYVVESTGRFRHLSEVQQHLDAMKAGLEESVMTINQWVQRGISPGSAPADQVRRGLTALREVLS